MGWIGQWSIRTKCKGEKESVGLGVPERSLRGLIHTPKPQGEKQLGSTVKGSIHSGKFTPCSVGGTYLSAHRCWQEYNPLWERPTLAVNADAHARVATQTKSLKSVTRLGRPPPSWR